MYNNIKEQLFETLHTLLLKDLRTDSNIYIAKSVVLISLLLGWVITDTFGLFALAVLGSTVSYARMLYRIWNGKTEPYQFIFSTLAVTLTTTITIVWRFEMVNAVTLLHKVAVSISLGLLILFGYAEIVKRVDDAAETIVRSSKIPTINSPKIYTPSDVQELSNTLSRDESEIEFILCLPRDSDTIGVTAYTTKAELIKMIFTAGTAESRMQSLVYPCEYCGGENTIARNTEYSDRYWNNYSQGWFFTRVDESQSPCLNCRQELAEELLEDPACEIETEDILVENI